MTKLRNIVGGSLFFGASVAFGLVSLAGLNDYHTSRYVTEIVEEMKPSIINKYGQKKYEGLLDTVKEKRSTDAAVGSLFALSSILFAVGGISSIIKKVD